MMYLCVFQRRRGRAGHLLLPLAFTVLLVACNQEANEQTITGGTEMKTGSIVYVALGDSTGAGVGAVEGGYVARLHKRLLEHRPESQLFNLCISGATTVDVLRRQLDQGVARKPDLVTLGIGINDIGHGMGVVTIAEFVENGEIMRELRAIGVDLAQGYHIARPGPLIEWLGRHRPVAAAGPATHPADPPPSNVPLGSAA